MSEEVQDIQTRLKETSQSCLEAHSAWEKDKKDQKAQEALHASIHELRKASSRLEIELAISERDQITSKPLPIPSHRSTSKGGDNTSILEDKGNTEGAPIVQSKPKRRRGGGQGQRKKAEG